MSGPVAIVDCGMGNLFSVQHACDHVGLDATVADEPRILRDADALILPGVGGFPDAMAHLRRRGLVEPIREAADDGRPLVGICLGMQLLLDEGLEFGLHEGLGLLRGRAVPFDHPTRRGRGLKVPHVSWEPVRPPGERWPTPLLEGVAPGTHFYFTHSFHAAGVDDDAVVATSRYGDYDFVAAVGRHNVVGFQFHPERSGPAGLRMYANLRDIVHG